MMSRSSGSIFLVYVRVSDVSEPTDRKPGVETPSAEGL
jgi:hypothetical protein